MLTVWILKGLPASGKSTFAKAKVANSNCSIKRINKDELRLMLDSGKYSKGNESYILQLRDHIILTTLDLGKSVIIDDTNLYEKHEERIRELVEDFNKGKYGNNVPKNPVQVKIKFFDVSPEECIKRDLKRPNSVGSKVIWKMFNTYVKKEEPKKIREPIKQDESLPNALIVDIDGTVALKGDRDIYNWEKVDLDLPNMPIIRIVNWYSSSGCKIIFLSGRDGRSREKTIKWLKHSISLYPNMWELYMRTPKDNRKDSIIKKELFDEYIKGKYYINFVLDDRNKIVELWRSIGLTCLQVADGNF